MIQNKKKEVKDGYVLFNGPLIKEIFTEDHTRLVMVFFSEVENE